jgi:glyoxylase-like metal-dependent hydrolase (beta-lactamase superfamily II)
VTEARPEIDSVQLTAAHAIRGTGAAGSRLFHPGETPYAELLWAAKHTGTEGHYELLPGVARPLDRYVTRIIAPNPGVMTGPGTNTYLVGHRQLAVIDPGPEHAAHLRAILSAGAGRIRWILCSHTHLDHAAAAAALAKATGAPIAAASPPRTEHDMDLKLDRSLHDGELLELEDGLTIRTVATPGHASNQVCFLLENTRMLFTGDHIMQGSTVVIWPPDGNMAAYLRSLQRLATFDLDIIAPGHGYLIGSPRVEIERLIQHRLARENKVKMALRKVGGRAALETLLPAVYDDVSPALHPLAARSLQAHLEKLVEEREVAWTAETGAYAFTVASP